MRVVAIKTPTTPFERKAIDEMHRLRARIFRGRLAWNVNCPSGLEIDEFDGLGPTYILALDSSDHVIGSARLLPATGATMLQAVFPQLLTDGRLDIHERMLESSRFCVDTERAVRQKSGSLHLATHAMFAGIIEWSILSGFSELATATDVRLERILRAVGWPLSRLGSPTLINETKSIAGILPLDWRSFEKVRPKEYSSDFGTSRPEAA